jgi:hypothetical protein
MMTQPGKHILGIINLGPVGNGGTVNHQDRQAQIARRDQLGIGAAAARILANHQIDGVGLQQCAVSSGSERPAINDQGVMGQARRLFRRVHETQQIVVLWLGGEGFHMHSSQRQHDAAGWPGQRGDRAVDVRNVGPAVTSDRLPRTTGQRHMRHPGQTGRLHRMTAHRRGEGVGGIDQMSHAMVAQIIGQPRNSAEPANPHRNRLSTGVCGPSGIAERRRNAALREQSGKRAGLGCAAQQEDIGHG